MDQCEVTVIIPFDPTELWSGSIIGSKPDTGVEMMAHIATATLPIVLLLIQKQENPVWQQCLEAMTDLRGPHFHAGMTSLAKYTQYLFNFQYNTTRTARQ
jgi:hypothetical protein